MKWYRPQQTSHTSCSPFHEVEQAAADRPHAVFTARRFHEMVQATADRPHVVFTVP